MRLTYDEKSIDFEKEIIFLELDFILKTLFLKYVQREKEIDFFLVIEKIISKVWSDEGVKKA
jgi:hypothetical protein